MSIAGMGREWARAGSVCCEVGRGPSTAQLQLEPKECWTPHRLYHSGHPFYCSKGKLTEREFSV